MHQSAARLYQAARALKKTEGQSALAKLLNESAQTVNNWETRGVSKQGALKAQAAIGCSPNWILSGQGPMEVSPPATSALLAAEPRTEFQPTRPERIRGVPVVGAGAGGSLPERMWTGGGHPVGLTDKYGEVASPDPHAFITKVVGLSMIPKYTPGDYALVEPGTEPDIEDDVLVRLRDRQTLLRKLLSRRGHVRLGSYNDPAILTCEKDEVVWMYYVAYPVPARKIKSRT